MSSARRSESKQPDKRRKVDWPAVERDYRTSQMTLRELGDKHGCDHAAIARKAKKDGWQRDLTEAVKQATNTKLIEAAVNKAVNDSQQTTTDVVLAVAELNKTVILKHRGRLEQLNKDADDARTKLITMAETISDIREASTYVSAVEASARTVKIVIEAERKAYGLEDKEPEGGDPSKPQKRVLVEFVEATNQ